MSEKEKWINAIRNNSAETIANLILADIERQKEKDKEIERLKNNWTSLKNFITDNCFYDTDTITFEELESKIMELEN